MEESHKEEIIVLDEGTEEAVPTFGCCWGPLIPFRF